LSRHHALVLNAKKIANVQKLWTVHDEGSKGMNFKDFNAAANEEAFWPGQFRFDFVPTIGRIGFGADKGIGRRKGAGVTCGNAVYEPLSATERRACRLARQPLGTQRYQPTQRADEDQLTQAIITLAGAI